MRIADFALERYFAKWEFAVQHVLGASDVEGWSMAELLELADGETRSLWDNLKLGYTESTGHPLLRREIATLYESIEADDVLVFAGAEEAIFCLFSTSLQEGNHVIVTWPGYQSLYEVARMAGAQVSLHALREEDGWSLDVDRLVRSFRPDTRMVVVNAPHNPTGMLPTEGEWRRLASACAAANIRLVADEVYRYLEHDGAAMLPAGTDLDPRAVSIGVMSKSFAMPGLRIGWIATRDRAVLDRCARMKDYTTICASSPSEVLALIGLRARDRVLARSREIVTSNLGVLDDFFARRSDALAWVRPRGGSIGFPRLVPGGPAGASADAFAERLVESTGVLVVPSTQFGSGDSHFRIGLGRADLPQAMAKVEAFLGVKARSRGLVLELLETVVLTVVIFLGIQTFVAQPYRVEGGSMEMTVLPDQYVLVDKLTPRWAAYKLGDIVVLDPPTGAPGGGATPFIKRVIGVAGDQVELKDGYVYLNGRRLEETYVFAEDGVPQSTDQTGDSSIWVVPAGNIFVMGDHRQASSDSRMFGPVEVGHVLGRAWLRYWPLDAFGTIGVGEPDIALTNHPGHREEAHVKTVRNPDTVHAPAGRYVHQIEVTNPGKVLFISGQVGERPDGSLPDDPNDQFEIAVENVLRNIAAAGLETSDLTKVTIYAVAELDPARRRATLDRLLGSHVSCSTFLYVAGLARPEYKVEVEGWAAA